MIEEHGILEGHWPAEDIQPKICQSGSAPAQCAVPKAGIGRGQACSPLPFQSSCRSPRWIERQPACWQTASSSDPSQRVLCCAQRGCCSVPVCRLPDSVPGMATAPADNAAPFQERILAPFWRSSHLPTPTERPKPVFPVPGAWYIVLLASAPRKTPPVETAWCNSTHQLQPGNLFASLWAKSARLHQIFFVRGPNSPRHGCFRAICGSPGIRPRGASPRTPSRTLPHVLPCGSAGRMIGLSAQPPVRYSHI